MKNQILNEEFHRMQVLAGLINENQLNEPENLLSMIKENTMKHIHTFESFSKPERVNEDYRNTDPSLKKYVGKTVKAILEDEYGSSSFVTIQFNDNTQMKITASPMGSGGVGLVVESLNEVATPRLLKSAGQNLARQVKDKKNYTVDQLS